MLSKYCEYSERAEMCWNRLEYARISSEYTDIQEYT